MARENDQFHSDMENMFKSFLMTGEEPKIMVAKNGKIIEKMSYHKVFFDSDMNIYKIKENGTLEKIQDAAFKAIVVKRS
jgi:hypothetical protein